MICYLSRRIVQIDDNLWNTYVSLYNFLPENMLYELLIRQIKTDQTAKKDIENVIINDILAHGKPDFISQNINNILLHKLSMLDKNLTSLYLSLFNLSKDDLANKWFQLSKGYSDDKDIAIALEEIMNEELDKYFIQEER